MNTMIHPNDLYNALRQLGLKRNEEMNLSEEDAKKLMEVYEEVILRYFRALFPNPTKQNFIRKRRDEYGRVEVDIICRSCGKQITVHNLRTVYCLHPAPCKNNFNEDKRSLFTFLEEHTLALVKTLGDQPEKWILETLIQNEKSQ